MESFKSSRRSFLGKSSAFLAGGLLLTPNLAFPRTTTLKDFTDISELDFKETNDLRKPFSLVKSIKVTGKVYATNGKTPLPNATIKVWHLSPKSVSYEHLGKITTNDQGDYEFWTDFPEKEEGKFPRIHFEVSHLGATTTTELLLGSHAAHITGKHWEYNQQLGRNLLPKMQNNTFETTINFNLTIN